MRLSLRTVSGSILGTIALLLAFGAAISTFAQAEDDEDRRLSLFVGVDVSGSFIKGKHWDNALDFAAVYIYTHLNGLGGAEKPRVLFVGSLGGKFLNEPKSFHPIQEFEHKSVPEIRSKLAGMFNLAKPNSYTDFNAFFKQVGETMKARKLILRPTSIVVISDGQPAGGIVTGIRRIKVKDLESLSRNITLRILYTSPVVASAWKEKVPRRRLKIWTQDATIMKHWNDAQTFVPGTPIEKQDRFFEWLRDNVDFDPRGQAVN